MALTIDECVKNCKFNVSIVFCKRRSGDTVAEPPHLEGHWELNQGARTELSVLLDEVVYVAKDSKGVSVFWSLGQFVEASQDSSSRLLHRGLATEVRSGLAGQHQWVDVTKTRREKTKFPCHQGLVR